MLSGRESLVRLIGKRRRFLPNRQSLLAVPLQGGVDLSAGDDGGSVTVRAEESAEDCSRSGSTNAIEISAAPTPPPPGSVTCPVCGSSIGGADGVVNSHLDKCLARGTKRKLRQLQLNFSLQPKVKIPSKEPVDSDIIFDQRDPHSDLVDGTDNMHGVSEALENDTKHYTLLPETSCMLYSDVAAKDQIDDEIDITCRVDSPSLPLNEGSVCDIHETGDDLSETALRTFIVGRKFGDKAELMQGETMILVRDPENVKDCNAIKVVSGDSGSCKVLGYLPRQVAQYLSPLMDKCSLTFEGCIATSPEDNFSAVPIQIICQNGKLHGESEYDNLQTIEALWKNACKSANTQPLSKTKYQQNFSLLLQEVLRSYLHVFSCNESTFLGRFSSLSDDSQRLFVRLYTRKGPWFRISNISYPDISDVGQASIELSEAGYIRSVGCDRDLQDGDLKEILSMVTIPDLREISYSVKKKCKFGARKQDFVELLLSSYANGLCPIPNVVLKKTGTCIQISSLAESLIWRAERLFFLNGEQDLSQFLLVDLGIVKYPEYNCIISNQVFTDCNELLAYEEAIEVAQIMDESLDENNINSVLRCIDISNSRISNSSSVATCFPASRSVLTFFSCFTSSWVYSKVVFLGVSFLERERRYSDAIKLLKNLLKKFPSGRRRGNWTLRLSIDLEHMGCINESLLVAEDGLLDPWVRAGSRTALQRRVLRLGKPPRRWKIPCFSESVKRKITEVHVQGRPLNCKAGTKSRFYNENGEQCGVEQLSLQYYAGEGGGWQGEHTESGIWLTIFGLLLWDAIFADVPDVFRTKFQTAPLDLETDDFYESRKNILEPLLEKISGGMAEEMLITSWELHSGTACRGINWDRHSLEVLRAAVTCIRGPSLASVCRHLAQDYRSWSSGMPDLLLWRFKGEYSSEAKVVEVKGPRDRLSEQQRAWLLVLMDCGLDVEVCKVTPAPSPT